METPALLYRLMKFKNSQWMKQAESRIEANEIQKFSMDEKQAESRIMPMATRPLIQTEPKQKFINNRMGLKSLTSQI